MKGRQIAIMMLALTTIGGPSYAQGMFGLGKFRVEQSDDRFSTTGMTTFSGVNNRISKKSVAGGIHLDGHGMFVEPMVVKRKADNAIAGLSFLVHNETEHDTAYGSPNSIGTPQRIAFLLSDGSPPIELEIVRGDSKFGDRIDYN